MKIYSSLLLLLVVTTFVLAPGWAQAGSGFYVSGDLGINIASGMDTIGTSDDRPSVCDEYINPSYDTVEDSSGADSNGKLYSTYNCTGSDRGAGGRWTNEFDGATGILAGAAVGYSFAGQSPNQSWGGLRVELEYFYRQSNYDQTADIFGGAGTQQDKLTDEIVQATDRIGSMTSHNLFGNLFYDFINTSRFTPYIGIGGGVGITNMEYGSHWARNENAGKIPGTDEYAIKTGVNLDNYPEIRRNLAKTFSAAQPMLSDMLYGLQILFGVDYAITEAASLGLKGRWVRFGSFSDDFIWYPLRSHPPNLRLDGSEPVSGRFKTDNVEFFGVSVNLKYHF